MKEKLNKPVDEIEVDDEMVVAAATDINAVLSPNPLLDLEKPGEELQNDVEELFENILEEDPLSDDTWKILKALGWKSETEEQKSATNEKEEQSMAKKPTIERGQKENNTGGEFTRAAADICKALTVNPPLDPAMGEEALSKEIAAMIPDIKEGDDLAVTTWATLKKLGWKPEVNKAAVQVEKNNKKAAKLAEKEDTKTKKPVSKPVSKPVKKSERYTRNQAVVASLMKTRMTIPDLAAKADKLFVENGGSSNLKQSEHLLRCILPVLELVNYITVEDGQVKKV